MFLSFSCGVCNDVFDSRQQQTSEQHSNGKLKGKKPNQKLISLCRKGAWEKGGKERKLGREGRYTISLSSPPPLSSLPLFWCLPCVQEADKISRFHIVNLKPQLNLIMIKVVINSCAVGTMKFKLSTDARLPIYFLCLHFSFHVAVSERSLHQCDWSQHILRMCKEP